MRALVLQLASVPLLAAALSAQSMEWSADFFPRGTTGYASDAVVFDDGHGPELFVAGSLGAAGTHADVDLAAWNGAAWRKIPAALQPYSTPPGNPFLQFMAVMDSGSGPELYVAGNFNAIEGVSARSLAKRTPGGWVAVGGNFLPYEDALQINSLSVVDDGSGPALYVGHALDSIAGQPAGVLTKWDGVQWTSVGGSLAGRVTDVAAFDDGSGLRLFVCGQALTSSGTPGISSVVVRNGSTWSNVGGAQGGVVDRLLVHDDGAGQKLFAAGQSVGAIVGVAHWNGVNWIPVGSAPVGGNVTKLEVVSLPAGPRLAAGGSFASLGSATSRGLALWDGATWNSVGVEGLAGMPSIGGVASCLASGDLGSGPRLFVSGAFTRADSVSALNVASWDGSSFEALGAGGGLSSAATTLAAFGGSVYVGGAFNGASGSTQPFLARWTGVAWDDAVPPVDAPVQSLQSYDDGLGEKLFVAGDFTQAASGFLTWDGVQASAAGALSPGGQILTQLVHDDGTGPVLYVGGKFSSIGGVAANNVARWDGANWSQLGSQEPNNSVHALAFHDDGAGGGAQLYAGGVFLEAGGQFVFGIARFDGAAWHEVGQGFNQAVFALESFDDGAGAQLYAGGRFSSAPPHAAERIARWDGVRWWQVGDGFTGHVYTLATFDDGSGPALLAGGSFVSSGATPMAHLAHWTGTAWTEFGGGASNLVNQMKVLDDGTGLGQALWVAGGFDTVGGDVVSSGVARWGKTCTPKTYCTSGTTSSGCAPTIAGLGRASASQASSLLLSATSLEGERSGHFFYGVNGPHAAPWGQSSHVLCVRAPTQRTGTQTTGGTAGSCDGAMALDWNAFSTANPGALGQPFAAGDDVWAQGYFRDPAGPKTTALSNAVQFTICP
jgi:hypothetical protein